MTAIRRSPIAGLMSRQGAVFVEQDGWEIPASFGNDAAEREAIRNAVAIADVTARAKVGLRGELDAVQSAAAGALVARIADDWALVLGPPGAETRLLAGLEAAAPPGSMVTDDTHLFAGFALCGPRLPELLQRTTSWDAATLAPGGATGALIAEMRSVTVRRDLSFPLLEIYVGTEDARYAWRTLAGVVADLGGGPIGWQTLRGEGWH